MSITTLISPGEVIRWSPESSKFPPSIVAPHILRKEQTLARSFLGLDFYDAIKADKVDISGKTAWVPGTSYPTGAIVDYFGLVLKSLADANTTNPCEDTDGTKWEEVRKFTSDCFENIWLQGLRDYLAYTVMAAALDHSTFPASGKGVAEWVDDASGSRSASYQVFVSRKNKLLADASESLENLKLWMYREHIDTESACDFSDCLYIKGCSRKPGIHRGRRFHFTNRG